MRKLLNTLYVTTPESYLSKDGLNVVVSNDGKELFRIPAINIESIYSFSYQGASPGVMKLCADNGIALNFYTPNGRFISRIQGGINGNILLRKRQFDILNDMEKRQRISSRFIFGKILNSRSVLRRFIRDYRESPKASEVARVTDRLKRLSVETIKSPTLELLRGIEGEAAAEYFNVFDNLILNDDPYMRFHGRSRRPPKDSVNAMLSFGYSLLTNDCTSALEGVGLDPAAGFMHSLRPGRNSLALDLMEELRAYMVDRFVLSLINNRQISSADFKIHTNPLSDLDTSVIFTDTGRKKFLSAWQSRKKTELVHPFLNEKIPIGLLPHVQAMMLARNLRGDLDDYPVFIIK